MTRKFVTWCCGAAIALSATVVAQRTPNPHVVDQPARADREAVVASAQEIAIAAVTFSLGDATAFSRAQGSFTADGWKEFMKHMQGFLDQGGAPTFTSSFVRAHDATVVGDHDGVLHIRIPGTLTQTNKVGRTAYRAALDVYAIRSASASGPAAVIQRLEQITCVGPSTACQ